MNTKKSRVEPVEVLTTSSDEPVEEPVAAPTGKRIVNGVFVDDFPARPYEEAIAKTDDDQVEDSD